MYEQERSEMAEMQLRKRGIENEKVLYSMEATPRHDFIPETHKSLAYGDFAVPAGHGQTISQPYIVAKQLELAEPQETDKILEIGSGTGYLAAVLSRLCTKVIGIEKIPELAAESKKTLEKLKIKNVKIVVGDGSEGDLHYYPYDKIIISAACPSIPESLMSQLKMGGIIVAPVGDRLHQKLVKAKKTKKGLEIDGFDDVVFVPLQGKHGFPV